MNLSNAIHERLMNESRTILPRVGGGVGVRGRLGSSIQDQSCDLTVGAALRAIGLGNG
jgi:hypothetical protein